MNTLEKIIAYDLGTGGIKASLFDTNGTSLAHTFQSYDTVYSGSDFHEQNPEDWWNGIVNTTKQLLETSKTDPKTVVGLSISGHSLGVVPIDKDGNLLLDKTPIWSDTRAKKQSQEFFNKISYEYWYMSTGNGFPAECYSIFKVMWYKENLPDVYKKIYKILGSKDYCNFKLTNVVSTDHSYASGSGIYNLKERKYQEEFIASSGIDKNIFPEIVSSHNVIGNLTEEAALILGLTTNTKVVSGGVDNSCMALGSKGNKNGRIYTSLGTSSWIAVITDNPILDIKYKPFVFAHCIDNMYNSATSIFSAGNSFRWVRDNLCSELYNLEKQNILPDTYTTMNKMISKSPIGANHLIFNPSLAGGSSQEESQYICGGFIGLNLSHTRSDLLRASMEGITYNLRHALDLLKNYEPNLAEMLIVGGGSKSALWRQMFADTFNMDIIKSNIDQDAASLGAAALAAYGLGYWDSYDKIDEIHKTESIEKPIEENVLEYTKHYELFKYISHFMAKSGDKIHELFPQT